MESASVVGADSLPVLMQQLAPSEAGGMVISCLTGNVEAGISPFNPRVSQSASSISFSQPPALFSAQEMRGLEFPSAPPTVSSNNYVGDQWQIAANNHGVNTVRFRM